MPHLLGTATIGPARGETVKVTALALLALAIALLASPADARAAELVMFEDPGCPWCRRWHAEIGPAYPLTEEGRVAPLRRVDIRDQARAGVSLAQPVTSTPTFVLSDKGREIGRIVGYPGSEFFYALLGNLLDRLPRSNNGERDRPASATNAVCCGQPSYDIGEGMVDTDGRLRRRTSMQ